MQQKTKYKKHPLVSLVEKLHYNKGANFNQCFIAAYQESKDGVLAYWAASNVTKVDPLNIARGTNAKIQGDFLSKK